MYFGHLLLCSGIALPKVQQLSRTSKSNLERHPGLEVLKIMAFRPELHHPLHSCITRVFGLIPCLSHSTPDQPSEPRLVMTTASAINIRMETNA